MHRGLDSTDRQPDQERDLLPRAGESQKATRLRQLPWWSKQEESATAASMLAAQGASLLEIADVLGHKTFAMIKRYSHLVVDHMAKGDRENDRAP